MFAIEVNFLTGRYVATAHHHRDRPEWPPHPARLFSALVATYADSHRPDPAERSALEWLEAQPSPAIHAPNAIPRSVATHFVPVNDARIISQGSYHKRAQTITELVAQIDKARSNGPSSKVQTFESRLKKQRDVSAIVSSAGNTPVRSAVEIMPPGWISTPDHVRTGQARAYPSVTPTDPRVTYMWDSSPGADAIRLVDGLCARLTRLGHSASLVSCRVVREPPTPNYVPGVGVTVLRSVKSGQLTTLEREYTKHRASRPRNLPFTPVRYQTAPFAPIEDSTDKPSTAGEWLVFAFRVGSRRYPSTISVEVASALRGAIFRHASDPLPEGLSGHRKKGQPSTDPHVAFLPLPWVGNEHSDGRLMGAAIAMPERLDTKSRRATLRAVGRWEELQDPLVLTLGRRGRLKMDRVIGPSQLVTLRPAVWSLQARSWVSATPIALPSHPGRLGSGTVAARGKAWDRAERAIIDSCRHVGLPEPAEIVISLAPLLTGARPASTFPAFRQPGPGDRLIARRLIHAAVTFDQPIVGPLVLGAGRYLGLGLMRPIAQRRSADG